MTKCLRFVLAITIATTLHFTATSQSISINTTGATADPSAILDVTSTTKGVLIPRMDKTQKNAIATPVTGLLVYQTLPDSLGFHYYDGTQWIWLSGTSDSTAWKITGNSNITSSNFLGTTNDSAVRFRVRNYPSGIIDSTSGNTALGYRGGFENNTTGTFNVAMGFNALRSNTTGSNNVGIGVNTGFLNDTASRTTAMGRDALYYSRHSGNTGLGYGAGTNVDLNPVTSPTKEVTYVGSEAGYGFWVGSKSTGVGFRALFNFDEPGNTIWGSTVGRNTAIGDSAMALTYASRNVAVGTEALSRARASSQNVAIGDSSMGGALNTIGNVAIGYKTLSKQQGQGYNTAVGYFSQRDSSKNTYYNSSIGAFSMEYNRTGIYNTGLGLSTLRLSDSSSYNTAVGADAMYNHRGLNGSNAAFGAFANRGDSVGYYNTAVGSEAMDRLGLDGTARGTGFSNVAVGFRALRGLRQGWENTAVGVGALEADSSGNYNTAVGRYASFLNKRGDFNVSMGFRASNNADTTINTVAIGSYAIAFNKQDNNVAVGYAAGYTAGSQTGYDPKEITYVGMEAGRGAWASNKNTAVGFRALSNTDAGFGFYDYVTGRNTVIGDSAMAFSIGGSNVVAGTEALSNTGIAGTWNNVAIGDSAMGAALSNSGALFDNVAIGYRSLTQIKNQGNIAIGAYSGRKLANTIWNTAIGYHALETDTTGSENTVVGTSAFRQNANGTRNASLGINTGYWITGSNNTFVGSYAGEGSSTGTTTATSNTALGYVALRSIRSGNQNTALGEYALTSDTSGSLNVAVGAGSMESHLRGNDNVAMGFWAGRSDTAAVGAVYIGKDAGYSNQRDYTVAIGYQALFNNSLGLNIATQGDSARYNTGVGYQALAINGKGGWNTALGYLANRNNTTGFFNTSVGVQALGANSIGNRNTALGTNALFAAGTASLNTAIGMTAGQNITGGQNTILGAQAMSTGITTGLNNVAIGVNALLVATGADNNIGIGTSALDANTTGDDNVAVGVNALTNTVAGGSNVAIGTGAGLTNNSGSGNTLIGDGADVTVNSLTNATAIGSNATVAQSNSLILGAAGTFVGVSNTTPSDLLHVGTGTGARIRIGSLESIEDFGANILAVNASWYPTTDNVRSLGITANRWTAVYAANGTIQTSDARDKENINDLNYGLKEIMKLHPVSFTWKENPQWGKKIGFIAQELQPVLGEAVQVGDLKSRTPSTDADANATAKPASDRLGIYYSDIIPVTVKAIQEQQQTIQSQQKTIDELKKKNEQLEKDIQLIKAKLGINN